jgi:hypothetical protein
MASNSRFCSSVDRPRFDGQSILLTLATHAPRNSRSTGGGAVSDGTYWIAAWAEAASSRANTAA